jgi:hypothetical protein
MLLKDACNLRRLLDNEDILHLAQALYMLCVLFSDA